MWTGYRTLDRHVLRRRLPARLRRRRGWRPGLHRVRYRVPQANHRRQKGGRRSAAADPIDEIELLRRSPHADIPTPLALKFLIGRQSPAPNSNTIEKWNREGP